MRPISKLLDKVSCYLLPANIRLSVVSKYFVNDILYLYKAPDFI